MDFNAQQFNFANAQWLYGILIVPAIWLLYSLFYKVAAALTKLEMFADRNLLPHLILNKSGTLGSKKSWFKGLLFWSAIWALAMLAMAGPRWNYTEIDSYEPEASLVILLDLSKSMDVDDVKPSRLGRAVQEVEDFLNLSKGIKVGLVAFANVPHLVSPITDDVKTIKYLLPSLNTGLVGIQGSSVIPALRMAASLLKNEPGDNKTILVISDGGFEDPSLSERVEKILDSKIIISSIGVGTKEGAPIPDGAGSWFKLDGKAVISKLGEDSLKEVAKVGKGVYVQADYLESDTRAVLGQIKTTAKVLEGNSKKQRFWEERFYIPLAVMMLLALPFFRRGVVFPAILLLCFLSPDSSYAFDWKDWFKNSDQQAVKALQSQEYDKAQEKFSTPYNKGVAEYKAGKYENAEKSFRADGGLDSEYNLGNSYAKQSKFEEAIKAYEGVLKKNPDHKDAEHNLQIVKKLQEQQKKDKKQDKKEDQQQQDKQEQGKGEQKKPDDKKDDNGQDKDKDQQQQGDSGKGGQPKDSQSQEGKPEDGDKDKKNDAQDKGNDQGEDKADKPEDKKDAAKGGENDDKEAAKQEKADEAKGDSGKEDNNPFMKEEGEEGDNSDEKRSRLDIEADQLLNRMQNDPDKLLKNQFNIEEQKNTNKGVSKPW